MFLVIYITVNIKTVIL